MTKFTEISNGVKFEVQSDEQGYWHGAYSNAGGRTSFNSLSYPSASECLEATQMLAQIDIAPEIAVCTMSDRPPSEMGNIYRL